MASRSISLRWLGRCVVDSIAALCYWYSTEDDMAEAARDYSGNMQAGEFLRFLKSRPKEERWQLVEGVAIMMNPPRMRHQQIALNLRDLLKDSPYATRSYRTSTRINSSNPYEAN